jgi:phage terminase large subunit-like protein
LSDDLNLEGLSRDQLLQLDEFLRETVKAKNDRPLDFIVPYDKQRLFFDLGSKLSTKVASERLLVAANKVGKTYAGAIEMAAHLTGLYPEWWNGRRFTHAIDAWAACDTHTLARDGAQRYLFGPPNDPDGLGSGLIPRHLIVGTPIAGHGATGLFDTARVRHVSGKTSSIQFKAYSQGRANVQSANLHVVWLDEQPPDIDLYTEFLARLLHTRGILYMTFTPLRDIAFVRERFYKGRNEARDYVEMSYEEKPGVTSEEIEMMKEQYPQHTWAARIYGKAELGAGAAFETTEKNLMFPADMYIPDYWPKIWGIDFGITHPFAAVLCAWDRDTDTFYVLDAFKLSDAQPIDHVDRMDRIAANIKVAWPHDGNTREKGSGKQLILSYRQRGLQTLPAHATWPDGSMGLESGIQEIRYRAREGKLKVKETLGQWFDEYRSYHTDEKGEYVRVNDDMLAATRYALMMRRYAKPGVIGSRLFPYRGPQPVKAKSSDFNLFTGRPD